MAYLTGIQSNFSMLANASAETFLLTNQTALSWTEASLRQSRNLASKEFDYGYDTTGLGDYDDYDAKNRGSRQSYSFDSSSSSTQRTSLLKRMGLSSDQDQTASASEQKLSAAYSDMYGSFSSGYDNCPGISIALLLTLALALLVMYMILCMAITMAGGRRKKRGAIKDWLDSESDDDQDGLNFMDNVTDWIYIGTSRCPLNCRLPILSRVFL
jgi:hypothetical protein